MNATESRPANRTADATPGLRRRAGDLFERPATAAAAALAGPLVVAAALIPARSWLTPVNVALVLVGVVVAVAMLGGRLAAFVAALNGAIWFDAFHTRPYYSFDIERHEDIVAALLLLAVGLAIGDVSTRSRTHRAAAAISSADIGRIHAIADLVASGEDSDSVILAVTGELRSLLALRNVEIEFPPYPPDDRRGRPVVRARIERDGSVRFGVLGWAAASIGLPARAVDLPVLARGREVARFVLQPTPGLPVDLDRRLVAVSLADQVGAAIVST